MGYPCVTCGLLRLGNTLRLEESGQRFADNIFKCIYWNENYFISIHISLKFVPCSPIDNESALVLIRASCRQAASYYLNTWTNIDRDPWCQTASIGLNELTLVMCRSQQSLHYNHTRWCSGFWLFKSWLAMSSLVFFYGPNSKFLHYRCTKNHAKCYLYSSIHKNLHESVKSHSMTYATKSF